jgi:hypothetical protein
MLYLSKTLRVLCPEIIIATRSGIPVLTIFLIALLPVEPANISLTHKTNYSIFPHIESKLFIK